MAEDSVQRNRWILHEASELANRLAPVVLAHGYDIALKGEVLFTGRAKQLDFVLIPLLPTADCIAAMTAVQQELLPTSITLLHANHWLLYISNRPVLIVAIRC